MYDDYGHDLTMAVDDAGDTVIRASEEDNLVIIKLDKEKILKKIEDVLSVYGYKIVPIKKRGVINQWNI